MTLEDSTRATILAHYYRAMVARADSWRLRMDATTNWAIVTTGAVISLAFGDPTSPHFVIHLASFLTLIFLLLEARRLTFYHLWQQRALIMERHLVGPATMPGDEGSPATVPLEKLAVELEPHLGTTAPTMSITKAAARRLRRVYVYLFAAQLAAWGVKLAAAPAPLGGSDGFAARAGIGLVPGEVVLGAVGLAFAAAVFVAGRYGSTSRGAA